jgi:opacity protein-like surface antigen
MKSFFVLIAILFFAYHSSADAADSRRKIPDIFQHSYLGFDLGYGDYHYDRFDLLPQFQARSKAYEHKVYHLYLGHYFNPYLALQISLMRPYYRLSSQSLHVRMSVLGITLRPTLPLNNRISIHGNIGPGYISRRGFISNDIDVVKGNKVLTLLTGGGISFKMSDRWFFDINTSYTLPNQSKNQPPIFHTGAGVHYLIFSGKHPSPGDSDDIPAYLFPRDTVQVGGFNRKWFNWEVPDDLPIFWSGDVELKSGITLTYQRNFFHTDRLFSFDWGVNLSRWVSKEKAEVFYGISLFPALKFWIIRSDKIDFYLTLGLAGPTFLSKKIIDDIDTGEHFTFYDFVGIGAFVGKNKHLNVYIQVAHYSNGNLFPENRGIRIPMTTNIGYAF